MRIPAHLNVGKWGFNNPFTEYWDDHFRSDKSLEWPEEVVKLSAQTVWRFPVSWNVWVKQNKWQRYFSRYALWA